MEQVIGEETKEQDKNKNHREVENQVKTEVQEIAKLISHMSNEMKKMK